MSKHVYLPVCVDEDGTFRVDFDGAPWMYVDSEDNVWNPEESRWESGLLESPNAELEAFATAQIARAAKLAAAVAEIRLSRSKRLRRLFEGDLENDEEHELLFLLASELFPDIEERAE